MALPLSTIPLTWWEDAPLPPTNWGTGQASINQPSINQESTGLVKCREASISKALARTNKVAVKADNILENKDI